MLEEYKRLINNKCKFISKNELNDFAFNEGLIENLNLQRYKTVEKILENINIELAARLIDTFKIGYTSKDVVEILNITEIERKKWTKMKLLKVVNTYEVRAYGQYIHVPIYDVFHTRSITQKAIDAWRNNIKPLTENQISGIEKAKMTKLKNRTCKECNDVVPNKESLLDGMCSQCYYKIKAIDARKKWMDNKSHYIIVDTETTGLDADDQIIEISIIDLDGNILLNTLVTPAVEITSGAYDVHGISLDYLKAINAPTFDQVYIKIKTILENKIMLAYNAPFDCRLIEQSCEAYNLDDIKIEFEDIMRIATDEYGMHGHKYISLASISESEQTHRALDDCLLCLAYIRNSVG